MMCQALRRMAGVVVVLAACGLGLSGCGDFSSDGKTVYPNDDNRRKGDNQYDEEGVGSVFGDDGLQLFGNEGEEEVLTLVFVTFFLRLVSSNDSSSFFLSSLLAMLFLLPCPR